MAWFLVDSYSPIGLPRSISSLGPEDQFFISVQPSPLIVSKHYLPPELARLGSKIRGRDGYVEKGWEVEGHRDVSLLLFLLRTHGHVATLRLSLRKIPHSVTPWQSAVLSLGFCPRSPSIHLLVRQVHGLP